MSGQGGFVIFIIIMVIGILLFICFAIYFFFKVLEFVIRAINLYEKMINRQDVIIKLLSELRGAGEFEKREDSNHSINTAVKYVADAETKKIKKSGQHHWSDDHKTHDTEKVCPKCGDIYHGTEFNYCKECQCDLVAS